MEVYRPVTLQEAQARWKTHTSQVVDREPGTKLTWVLLEGVPHVVLNKSIAYHFRRDETGVVGCAGWFSTKAKREFPNRVLEFSGGA